MLMKNEAKKVGSSEYYNTIAESMAKIMFPVKQKTLVRRLYESIRNKVKRKAPSSSRRRR